MRKIMQVDSLVRGYATNEQQSCGKTWDFCLLQHSFHGISVKIQILEVFFLLVKKYVVLDSLVKS